MEQDTVASLMEKISLMGADLLLKSLDEIENGTAVLTPQDETQATKCTMLKKEQAVIDFNNQASKIVNFVRGLQEWPVAYCHVNGIMLKIYQAKAFSIEQLCEMSGGELSSDVLIKKQIGEVVMSNKKGIFVKCNNSILSLIELQLEGGKKLSYKDFVNGKKLPVGTVLN